MRLLRIITILFTVLSLSAPVAALEVNDPAPPISLRDSNNAFFYLSNYIGRNKKEPVKGVIVNFFSSTCVPCKNELPVLNSLVDEFEKKGIRVVIIGYKENFDGFSDLLEGLKVDKPIILADPYGKTGEKYGVYGLPMTILIGSDGKVKYIIKGELPNIDKVLIEKTGRLFK